MLITMIITINNQVAHLSLKTKQDKKLTGNKW